MNFNLFPINLKNRYTILKYTLIWLMNSNKVCGA